VALGVLVAPSVVLMVNRKVKPSLAAPVLVVEPELVDVPGLRVLVRKTIVQSKAE